MSIENDSLEPEIRQLYQTIILKDLSLQESPTLNYSFIKNN